MVGMKCSVISMMDDLRPSLVRDVQEKGTTKHFYVLS